MSVTCLMFGLLFTLFAPAPSSAPPSTRLSASPLTVRLKSGVLEGVRFGPAPNEVAFLGIPYAAPPVGARRWTPPQPVSPWSGVRKATTFGASCPQLPQRWLRDLAWNEDCLHVSVWTTAPGPSAKLPVVVWLHGGSNKAGRSHNDLIGPALARRGVVFVAVNYRLGPFGFLAHPWLTAESGHRSSGNYGLLDQLEALRWVRENIAAFGGDPARVTLMGQSAGAVDACLLMTSPLAAGLFHRAILHSGECQATLTADIRATLRFNGISGSGEAMGQRLARALAVTSVAALRDVPAETIMSTWRGHSDLTFGTIVDGWVIPDQPARIVAAGKHLDIPVLVGSNTDEATIFNLGAIQTVDQYKAYLAADTGPYADRQLQAYPVVTDAEVPTRFLQLMTDSFGFGAHALARAVTRTGQRAYLYSFSYASRGARASLGAFHGAELMVLGGVYPDDWERAEDDDRLGEAMRGYWVRFAATGDPNEVSNATSNGTSNATTPRWRAYDPSEDQCLDLGRTIAMRPVPRAAQLAALESIMQRIVAETNAEARPD
jgi:para-nitrobenzyl esterase